MLKKIGITVFLIGALAFQIGCSGIENAKGDPVEEETSINLEENIEEKEILDDFYTLIDEGKDLRGILDFIGNNISNLSRENASMMIIEFEKAQRSKISELEEKFYDSEIQGKLADIYLKNFNMEDIYNSEDKEIKDIVILVKESGFKIDTAEGMFYPVIDYERFVELTGNVTDDIKEYIDIMAEESKEPPAKDAALVIGWDQLIKRALKQEEFISKYGNSSKIEEVKALFNKYTSFILYGLNNTPLFKYDTKEINQEAKSAYLSAIEDNKDSKLIIKLSEYLEMIDQEGDKLTKKVEELRERIKEDLTF